MTSEKQLRLPPDDLKWEKNKSNAWPKLMYEDLVDYLIHAKAYDGKAMKSFRSLYGYNYVQNGWIGDMWSIECEDMVFDRPSPFQLKPCTEKTANKTNTDTDCPPRTEQFLDHIDLQDFVSNSTVANIWECKGMLCYTSWTEIRTIARAWYERVSGHKVRKSGIVVSLTEPYIAASPDGIIDERTFAEIKCPTRPLEDLISSGKYDVLLEDGQPKLSPKGKKWLLLPIAMFCTESTLCKFVVWTAEKQCVVDVQYSKDFIKGILPRICDFYFKHLLVRLTDEFQASRLKISPEYKSLCR
ncbi:LOW QUALITY PROTEIN: hypothetical protein MAR_025571 [Mya arenaria]|uniref:YqaJ viral recombinase domain-containing protein n=1 Tax=Mya arenaria TaxID=6604 RepID=A0ABY7ERP0_MYAAR|nr:LOW QUALITY PROTEIN: hypothetical protein MAR_025571 [Mya arenaria]